MMGDNKDLFDQLKPEINTLIDQAIIKLNKK